MHEAKRPATARFRETIKARHGGKYLFRGEDVTALEGDWEDERLVILEFETVEAAWAWYRSAATDEGSMFAGCVVLATGWETPRLAAGLGIDVPVRGVRGWIVTTRPAPFRLRRPLNEVDFSGGVAAAPLLTLGDIAEGNVGTPIVAAQMRQDAAGRLVLGASLAPAMGDADDDGAHAVPSICRRAIELIPPIAEVPIAETRTCVRPVSFDGLPLHGPVDGIDGLVLACGHGSHGLTWGPGCGEAVARGVLEGEWDPELLPVRLERKVG